MEWCRVVAGRWVCGNARCRREKGVWAGTRRVAVLSDRQPQQEGVIDGGASRSGSGGPLTLVGGVLGTHRFARVGGRPPPATELSLGSNLMYMVRFV
jgi:hypothetical protein